ncbi:hypothetical protein HPPN120_07100 [Helicobacter pylori Puno120]|uniref:hypothetical protein n=1 Tax=Helicobacter pylori TaxID=210 RepID=UPI00022912D2|nr:hypothetical protein [Helicobacter pylori]AEN16001.1 hypothetical protein HPPN120_07100 [Helicobacter pylori Puno120]
MKDPITQAIQEQKERSITPTHKTRSKPLTREPKKSVLEPELKNILTPKTPTHN